MKHSDLERLLAEQGQELMRQLYQDCVEQQAQAEVADEVVARRAPSAPAAAGVGDDLRHGAGSTHLSDAAVAMGDEAMQVLNLDEVRRRSPAPATPANAR